MHVSYKTHIASLHYIENFSTYIVSRRSRSPPLSGTFERSHGIFHKHPSLQEHREVKRSRSTKQNKHRRFLERSNEVTPFHPASRLKPSGRKFVHAAGKVSGLWLVRSTRLVFFDTGQSLLVDFCLCASTRLVFFTLVSRCWWTLACALPLVLSFLTLVSRCWWTLACAFPCGRHLPLCDMRGDIDHNVTCMKTFTVV